jgi:hypothetical protein
MDVRWLTAFVDVSEADFAQDLEFWAAVTGSALSAPRGDAGEFVTLLPADGDPVVRVQRTADQQARVHLDLHVTDVASAVIESVALGATVVDEFAEWTVLSSPAGFVFCHVADEGEATVPAPIEQPRPHRFDQVSIDIPGPLFADECVFWRDVTGWQIGTARLAEFAYLERPDGLPLRVLFQRLGDDDPATAARAHLDLACGDGRHAVAERHLALGATHVRTETYWITLASPTGMEYCLTARDPASGYLSS